MFTYNYDEAKNEEKVKPFDANIVLTNK